MNTLRARSVMTLLMMVPFSAILCGCANQGYSVIASTATTIGFSVSENPANGSLDTTLGYKRAEFAFVPTNRNAGKIAGGKGDGAKDTGNVIMELRYSGDASSDSGSAIYQRLAVGEEAVKRGGAATLLFAKGPDGKLDAESEHALQAVMSLPAAESQSTAEKVPLAEKFTACQSTKDAASLKKFHDAAVKSGFRNFNEFLQDNDTTLMKIRRVRDDLVRAGITFD